MAIRNIKGENLIYTISEAMISYHDGVFPWNFHQKCFYDARTSDEQKGKNKGYGARRPFTRKRDCRHCGGQHWDLDCPTRTNVIEERSDTGSEDDVPRQQGPQIQTTPDSDSDTSGNY